MSRNFFNVLALAGALLSTPAAFAQTVGTPLQVRTGDAFTVEIEYTQAAELGGQEINARMTQVYAVQVLDAENRLWRFLPVSVGYEMPQTLGVEAQALAMNWQALSDALSAMVRVATDVGFDCRVDEYGRCIDMSNWPFWSARVENVVLMLDGFARAMPRPALGAAIEPSIDDGAKAAGEITQPETEEAPVPPGPTWEELRGPVLQGVARLIDAFDSRDAAATMTWANLPALVQGRTLTRRQPVNFVDEYDMPFGAPPLRFTGTLQLERIDRRNNAAVVERRAMLDQASARASLRAMTEFVSGALIEPLAPYYAEGEQPPTGQALIDFLDSMLADLAYEETMRGVIDLETGMARETTTEYTLSMRLAAAEEPIETRGRIVTRVRPSPPQAPRLPRQ